MMFAAPLITNLLVKGEALVEQRDLMQRVQ